MKTDIILSGVGGQGILTIAAVIGYAALNENLYIKQAEVHGMSQRGGAVQSNLRISDKPIHSDLIPEGNADIILSVEPLEALRYLSYLSKDGWIVTNEQPFVNINNYPDIDAIYNEIEAHKNHIMLNADKTAKETGNPKSSNIIMLGAAAQFIHIRKENILLAIQQLFERKGSEVIEQNIMAFDIGWSYTEKIKKN